MTMTRQDFVLIAETINSIPAYDTESGQDARELAAYKFAKSLAATNPAFNRERFLRACGVSDA